jgi:hypothetical protein
MQRRRGMRMAKLLLTSAGFYNESIKVAFVSLYDQRFDKMKTAIITTASVEQKANNHFARKAKEEKYKKRTSESPDVRFRYADIFCFFSVCCAAFFTCG